MTTDGKQIFHCNWAFDYRIPDSMEFFTQIAAEISDCAAARISDENAAPVNHPDTHLVRNYTVDGRSVTVSLKDKAALGRTYVFVTVRH